MQAFYTHPLAAACMALMAGGAAAQGEQPPPSAAAAQAQAQTLSPVKVTATRIEQRVEDIPANVSVISARDIQHQHLLKPQDALTNTEGVDFNTADSDGKAATLSVRGIGGSFAGQTSAVMLDGMPTDTSFSPVAGRGGFNFVADQDIERIELVRGPASVLYGPNVVGGMANIVTKRWDRDTGVDVNLGYGSHNARSLGAAVGTANDRFDVRLSAQDYRTNGFKAMPVPDPWGGVDLRDKNWRHQKWSLNGGLRPADNQEITFNVQRFDIKQPYTGSTVDAAGKEISDSSEALDGTAVTLGYRIDLSEVTRLKFNYRHFDHSQSWTDVNGGMGVGGRNSVADVLEAQLNTRPFAGNLLIAGLSASRNRYHTWSLDFASGITNHTRYNAQQYGIFVQDEQQWGNWTATLGARYDWIVQDPAWRNGVQKYGSARDGSFNPRLGLRYAFGPRTSAYASIATAYVPADSALMYGDGKRFLDNLGLKPETSISYELGMHHDAGWGKLRAAVYHTDYSNKIDSMPVGAGVWPRQFINVGKTTVDGIELGVDTDLPGGWKPYANYSYTRSIIRDNPSNPELVGKSVQRIVPHKLNVGVIYVPGERWNAALMGRYFSRRYFSNNNTLQSSAAPYFVADARVNVKLPVPKAAGQWTASLSVNNLFDKKYSTWEYAQADRRNFWLGLSGRF